MEQRTRCRAMTKDGPPCRSFSVSDRGLCVSHDPELRVRKAEGSRRGGEAKANARRAAKVWAAAGQQMSAEDLPAVLRSCMLSVKAGRMEPGQASAIANLARVSVQLTQDLELDARLSRLEEQAGIASPSPIRRVK